MASKSRKRRKARRRARVAAGVPSAGPEGDGERERSVPAKPTGRSARTRADRDQPPPAPWGSFPLVELTVLVGIVLIVVGFILMASGNGTGATLLMVGLALGSIGGLETSIREHFAGYRSHTVVLAGVPALAVLAILFVAGPAGLPGWARAAIAIAVFGLSVWLLTVQFSRSSGGLRYKLSTLPGRRR